MPILRKYYGSLRRLPALPRPDLPFSNDDAVKFLPWIIACMVCLTALMLAAALSVSQTIGESSDLYGNTLTIHIPHSDEGSGQELQDIMGILASINGVRDTVVLEKSQLQELVSPWLGDGASMDMLPIPVVIDVIFDENIVDIDTLRDAVNKAVPTATLQGPKLWVDKFSSFNSSIRAVALVMALLLLSTTVALVALSAKTALKLHHNIVALLHSIGAKDEYIVRQFQLNSFVMALKGASIGTVVAIMVFSLFVWITQGLEAPLLPVLHWSVLHIITFLLLPLITASASLYIARKTVFAELESMP